MSDTVSAIERLNRRSDRDKTDIEWSSRKRDLEIRICSRPDQRDPGHPIFAIDCLSGALLFFRGKDARHRREFGTCDFAADRARRNLHGCVVPNALRLAHVVARHDIKLAVLFAEPYWCRNTDAGFAECGQGNVFLAADCGRNLTCHDRHCSRGGAGKIVKAGQISADRAGSQVPL